MRKIALIAAALLAAALLPSSAQAQSGCSFLVPGAVLTPAQWNACFQAKQDKFGGTPITGITGTAPISVTATATPVVSVALATSGAAGVVQPDNVTITVNGSGVITAVGAVASSIDAGGATSISNGTNGFLLFDNAGKVGATNSLGFPFTINAGTLAAGAQAFTVTATQPASPVAAQQGMIFNITSAGTASQNNNALQFIYGAGYTGSNRTSTVTVANGVAGTAATLPGSGGSNPLGNAGVNASSTATTSGYNFGLSGEAQGGNINIGVLGFANVNKNSATNIGLVGFAQNGGTSPVQIGVLASLNTGVAPNVSAALIADNGTAANPVARFKANGTDKFVVDNNGTPTVPGYTVATLPSSNQTTGNLAYVSDAQICAGTVVGGGSGYCLVTWNGSGWTGNNSGRYQLPGTGFGSNAYIFHINGSTGNDSNPGTAALPWRTCQHGVDFLANNIDANAQSIVLSGDDMSASTAGTTPGFNCFLKTVPGIFDFWPGAGTQINANGSFTTGSTTITMSQSNPGWVFPGYAVYDNTVNSPTGILIGTVSSYSGTTLTLTTTSLSNSSGTSDALTFGSVTGYFGSFGAPFPLVLQGNLLSPVAWTCNTTCLVALNSSGWRVQGFNFHSTVAWIEADAGAHIYIGQNSGDNNSSVGQMSPFGCAYTAFCEFVGTITDNVAAGKESSFIVLQFGASAIAATLPLVSLTNNQAYGSAGFYNIGPMSQVVASGTTYVGSGAAGSTGQTFSLLNGGTLTTGGVCAFAQTINPGTTHIPGNTTGNTLAVPGGTTSGWCN